MIEEIKKLIPGMPIVRHGSSTVPVEEVRRINATGGKLYPSASGVSEEVCLPAAKLGVSKVNIDTDGRLVWTRVHREYFRDHPPSLIFARQAKSASGNMRSSSLTRTENWAQPDNSTRFGRA